MQGYSSDSLEIAADAAAYDEEVTVIGAVNGGTDGASGGAGLAGAAAGLAGTAGLADGRAGSAGQGDVEEGIRALMAAMPGQRRLLTGIIDFCRDPRRPAEVDEFTAGLWPANVSVYTPVLLRQHLQEAGALVYLQAEGQDGPSGLGLGGPGGPKGPKGAEGLGGTDGLAGREGADTDADGLAGGKGVDGGVEYLVVGDRDSGRWLSSAAALKVIDGINPALEIAAMLDDEPQYREVYLRILGFCAAAPRSKEQINAVVDDDPLLQKPRHYSGYFIDRLDACGALEWRPGWEATPAGRGFLPS